MQSKPGSVLITVMVIIADDTMRGSNNPFLVDRESFSECEAKGRVMYNVKISADEYRMRLALSRIIRRMTCVHLQAGFDNDIVECYYYGTKWQIKANVPEPITPGKGKEPIFVPYYVLPLFDDDQCMLGEDDAKDRVYNADNDRVYPVSPSNYLDDVVTYASDKSPIIVMVTYLAPPTAGDEVVVLNEDE